MPQSQSGRAALLRSVVTFYPFMIVLNILYHHFINNSSGLTITDFLASDNTYNYLDQLLKLN
jgi:hypothetical protein